MTEHAWSRQEFEQKLREKGAYYHIHHPFHKRMNEGHCSVDEIQGWVANRLYYQMAIPVKDAAILANCEDHHFKYPLHRVPDDAHIHFFGTSKLSFSTRKWKYQKGDVVKVISEQFYTPLINIVGEGSDNQSDVFYVDQA